MTLNTFPSIAHQKVADSGSRDAIALGYCLKTEAAPCVETSDFPHLYRSQYGMFVSFSYWCQSHANRVLAVLRSGDVLKVLHTVIQFIAVYMINFVAFWARPKKRNGNQPVDSVVCCSVIGRKPNLYIPVCVQTQPTDTPTPSVTLDAPLRTNFVESFKSLNGSPFFCDKILFGHGKNLPTGLSRWLGSFAALTAFGPFSICTWIISLSVQINARIVQLA